MAAIVKSVERVTLTLATTETSDSAALSKGQTTGNCIPFVTNRVTTTSSSDFPEYLCDVYFSGGNVVADRASGADTAIVVEVSVIEFDTSVSNTRVEQGTFTIGSGVNNIDVDPRNGNGNITTSKAFPYITWKTNVSTGWGHVMSFVEFTDGTNMDIDRVVTGTDVNGHWYVVQSDEFTVQAHQLYTGTSQTASSTLSPSVTLADTFVVGGYKAQRPNAAAEFAAGEMQLATGSVSLTRNSAADYIQGTAYVVSMDDTCGNVQHGRIANQAASTASQNVTITEVDLTRSIVLPVGLSQIPGGQTPAAGANAVPDVCAAWDFASSTQARVQHSIADGAAGSDFSWQVIEWELTAGTPAPARRVMVIS